MDRSIRYHNTGFASASVKATCNVDCHGSRLCGNGQHDDQGRSGAGCLTTANAIPTKAPILRTAEYHNGPSPLSVAKPGFVDFVVVALPLPSFGLDDRNFSHKESTSGKAFPSRTPKNPQEIWYARLFLSTFGTGTGVMCCVLCRCVIIEP